MVQVELRHGDWRHDRRRDRRYGVGLDLQFSYSEDGVVRFGTGSTQDISSGGICFSTATPPRAGLDVKLQIAWPHLLQNVCPLELLVWGATLRSDSRGTMVRIRSYEFRTCGQRSFNPPVGCEAAYNVIA